MVDFLFTLTELFIAVYYGSGVTRRNVYSLAVFTAGRPVCTKILHGQGCPPSTILGIRKLETLGYPMVKTYRSVMDRRSAGQTDRQTSGYAVTALAKLALRRTVKRSSKSLVVLSLTAEINRQTKSGHRALLNSSTQNS